MTWPFKGRTVTVLRPVDGLADPFGAPTVAGLSREDVHGVLVSQPSTEAVEQTTRQYGAACELTLNFPKSYTAPLRGCSVELPAPWSATFEVIGEPQPLIPELTPDGRNRDVHVRRVIG